MRPNVSVASNMFLVLVLGLLSAQPILGAVKLGTKKKSIIFHIYSK